jgi:hypothetical protein
VSMLACTESRSDLICIVPRHRGTISIFLWPDTEQLDEQA